MIKFIKVTGNSLSPFFLSGDFAVINTRPHLKPALEAGDVVVVEHPVLGTIIKRVRSNHPAEEILDLEGTHPASTPAKKIGPVSYQDVVGKVVFHIKRPR